MIPLFRVHRYDKPFIRLARVQETDSKRTWIFTFTDPVHKYMQTIIVMKDLKDVAGAVENAVEKIYCEWKERIRYEEQPRRN